MKSMHERIREHLLKRTPRRHGDIPLTLLPSRIDEKHPRYHQVKEMLTYDQLPSSASVLPEMAQVSTFNQGQFGTCQTVCWTKYMKALQAILGGYWPTDGQGFSAKFNYDIMKASQPVSEQSTAGGSIDESLVTGQTCGVVPESDDPYSTMTTDVGNTMPSAALLAQGSHKLGAAHPIYTETDASRSPEGIMNAIYYKKGALIGVLVCGNFLTPVLQPDGSYLIPLPDGTIEGGHALFAYAYEKTTAGQASFDCIWNSWGPDWPATGMLGKAKLDSSWLTASYDPLDMSGPVTGFFGRIWRWVRSLFINKEIALAEAQAYYLMEAWAVDDGVAMIVMTVGNSEAIVNDTTMILDQPPVNNNGRVYVPIRFVAEQLGATVDSSKLPTITITWGSNTLALTIGSTTATLNGKTVTIDQPPYIDAATGRTMVPARFIAETMGATVTWVPALREVVIVM